MKTLTLRLVRLGSAKALTRDGLGAEFMEDHVQNGMWPAAG